jgi:hypothetical protein
MIEMFQYEKGKPLVNLVDNMVKLGSLYRGSGMSLHHAHGGPSDVHSVRERLEFNQKVQEQRLLAEERRDWDRVSPDRGQLQASTGVYWQSNWCSNHPLSQYVVMKDAHLFERVSNEHSDEVSVWCVEIWCTLCNYSVFCDCGAIFLGRYSLAVSAVVWDLMLSCHDAAVPHILTWISKMKCYTCLCSIYIF